MHREVRLAYSIATTVFFTAIMLALGIGGKEWNVPFHIVLPALLGTLALFVYVKIYVIYRDNLSRAKKYVRQNRPNEAVAELELGAENRHVRCIMALGDMALLGRVYARDPVQAARLYDYAVQCMDLHQTDPECFMFGRAEMPTPATRDSMDASVNRRRLQKIAANLEDYGNPGDPQTRELLLALYDRLGHRNNFRRCPRSSQRFPKAF